MSNYITDLDDDALSRGEFVKATYKYLIGAIVVFAALSFFLSAVGVGTAMLKAMGGSRFAWLGVLGGFMLVSWLATHMADTAESNNAQIGGLGLYTLAEAILFAPMFALAGAIVPDAIFTAVVITALLVAGLTWTAMTTKTDFSFLGGLLKVGGLVAIGAIVVSAIAGFSLGIWFSALMIIFAGGAVLYDTSNIIHHYPTNRPAGAALHLFSSVMLMLWYVLRLLIQLASDD